MSGQVNSDQVMSVQFSSGQGNVSSDQDRPRYDQVRIIHIRSGPARSRADHVKSGKTKARTGHVRICQVV